MSAPVIDTPRTRLRPHVMADADAFWDFFQTDRAQYTSAPDNRTHAWYGFASEVGSWDLVGHGGWAIETQDGALLGQVAITQPPHFPELEIGWLLFDPAYEGQGYMREAAHAALDWAWANLPIETLVSYIDPANDRSIALATRLGAVHDPAAPLPEGETAEETAVYRHARPDDADGSPEAYA